MRLEWVLLAVLAAPLGACGGTPAPQTVSVRCRGDLVLAGARSIDVVADPGKGGATLSYPDPVNAGQTGTIAVAQGNRCTIATTGKTG